MVLKRMDEFEEVVPSEPGVKGVRMRVLSPEGRPFVVRLFCVDPGGHTPRHSHGWEHQVVVLSGRGEVLVDGRRFEISEGDYLFVPPNAEHQFLNTSDVELRFICVIPSV